VICFRLACLLAALLALVLQVSSGWSEEGSVHELIQRKVADCNMHMIEEVTATFIGKGTIKQDRQKEMTVHDESCT
jgi:uncharacterized protein involved in tolerance to divalent cations